MASDESDKTVFRHPVPGGNRTEIKQRPVLGQQGAGQSPQGNPHSPGRQPSAPPGSFQYGNGLNPVVNLASTLIAVFEKTRQSMAHDDIAGLHQRLSGELRKFETRAREAGIPQELILSARYLLCSVLDESVLHAPWGGDGVWAQRTLLSVFHNETSGGEKCFLILDRLCQSPAENLDIIELFYICLSLGFEGKYRLAPNGKDQLESLRDELFSIIRRHRGEYERSLSARWQGLGNVRRSLEQYLPIWVVAVALVAVLFFGYSGFRYWLYATSAPVVAELRVISGEKVEPLPGEQSIP